jgi:hypothetical protein
MGEAKRVAVVDGANIAFAEKSKGGKPKLANLLAVRDALSERGYRPILIVDATLRHEIDDAQAFEALIDKGEVHQAPAGTEADYFVLKTAQIEEGVIVSNDRFDKYAGEFGEVRKRRIPLMIVNGNVQIYCEEYLDKEPGNP